MTRRTKRQIENALDAAAETPDAIPLPDLDPLYADEETRRDHGAVYLVVERTHFVDTDARIDCAVDLLIDISERSLAGEEIDHVGWVRDRLEELADDASPDVVAAVDRPDDAVDLAAELEEVADGLAPLDPDGDAEK